MRGTKIGVDIGSNKIRLVTLDDMEEIVASDSYEVADIGDEKEYLNSIKAAISMFVRDNKIRRYKLYINIPLNKERTEVNILEIPKMNTKLIELSVLNEVENTSFVKVEDYTHRWGLIEKQDDSLIVLSSLVDKKFIATLSKLKNVAAIEIQPVTVGRMLNSDAVYIDFGHQSTRIYAYKQGLPVDMQIIPIGGEDIIKGIMERCGETYGVACEKLMSVEEMGDDDELSRQVSDEIRIISSEVKRIVRGMEINKGLEIEEVFYSGGLFNITNFLEYMKQDLGYSMKAFEKGEYALAASSASFETYKYMEMLNYYTRDVITVNYTAIFAVLLTIIVSVVVGNELVGRKYAKVTEDTLTMQDSVRSANNSINQQLEMAKQEKANLSKDLDILREIIDKKQWMSDAYIVAQKAPKYIVIHEITTEPGVTMLNGFSARYKDVAYFAILLEDHGKVTIEEISEGKFTIRIDHSRRLLDGQ